MECDTKTVIHHNKFKVISKKLLMHVFHPHHSFHMWKCFIRVLQTVSTQLICIKLISADSSYTLHWFCMVKYGEPTFKIHTSGTKEQNTITTVSSPLCVIGMSDYFHRKHKLNYCIGHVCLMIKLHCLHCNYLHITVIIWKCAKRIIPFPLSLAALTMPLILFQLGPKPVTCSLPLCLHADFDIAKQSIDPLRRNASHPDYNEDSWSFKMLMANFT